MSLFGPPDYRVELKTINTKLDQILMKESEALEVLKAVKEQLSKAKDEILAKIASLESTDPDLSPEGAALVEDLKNIGQALDDVVKDVE